MEIEKRYEINGEIPQDKIESKMYIEQTYSVVGDKKSIPDVRIRKIIQDGKTQYFHTVKYKTDNKNARIEVEQAISEEEYNKIFDIINKKPIRKNRYLIPIGNSLIAEVDEFLDKNVTIVEVEFPDEETMNNFGKSIGKPDWIGNEIKNKQSFSVQIFSELNRNIDIKFY